MSGDQIDRVSTALDKCGQERGCRIPAIMLKHFAAAAIAAMPDPEPAISRELDDAIQDELDHGPKDIMR